MKKNITVRPAVSAIAEGDGWDPSAVLRTKGSLPDRRSLAHRRVEAYQWKNKILLFFLSITIMQLDAAPNLKKIFKLFLSEPSEQQKLIGPEENQILNQKEEAPPTPEKQPFHGHVWETVHIAPDTSIYMQKDYSWQKNNHIQKWNFEGLDRTTIAIPAYHQALFTNNYGYVINYKEIKKVDMRKEATIDVATMQQNISRKTVSEAGVAVFTNNLITRFDAQGKPHSNLMPADSYDIFQLFDDGDLLVISPKTKMSIFYDSNNEKKTNIQFATLPEVISKKKIGNDILIANLHPTVANRYEAQLINITDGNKHSFPLQQGLTHIDSDDTTIALGCNEINNGKIVKLFDIETTKCTYGDVAKNIGGHCAMRLIEGKLYIVGDNPKPKSMIIDPREKP